MNILSTTYKLCSFDCVYCQYGRTEVHTLDAFPKLHDLPTPDDFQNALQEALRKQKDVAFITFSGNGEPTLHPHFEELVDVARELKKRYAPGARLAVLSNSSTTYSEKVIRGLERLDVRIMKLDAGGPETFRKINRPCRELEFGAVVRGLKSVRDVIIQAMFVDGKFQNVADREIDEWMSKVIEISPVQVQIYSLHRLAAEEGLEEVRLEKLNEIAQTARQVTKVPVEVVTA